MLNSRGSGKGHSPHFDIIGHGKRGEPFAYTHGKGFSHVCNACTFVSCACVHDRLTTLSKVWGQLTHMNTTDMCLTVVSHSFEVLALHPSFLICGAQFIVSRHRLFSFFIFLVFPHLFLPLPFDRDLLLCGMEIIEHYPSSLYMRSSRPG